MTSSLHSVSFDNDLSQTILPTPSQSLDRDYVPENAAAAASPESLHTVPKEALRLVTSKPRPAAPNLSLAMELVSTPLPSALATAHVIENINTVSYPEGIMSPRPELNPDAEDGKFRYDRDFLLQFMQICKAKPDHLIPLEAIGLDPLCVPKSLARSMSRGGPGRQRAALSNLNGGNSRSSLGITNSYRFNEPSSRAFGGPIGSFAIPNALKLSSEDRFPPSTAGGATANGGSGDRAALIGTIASMVTSRTFPTPQQANQDPGESGPPRSKRTRSKRGEKRRESGEAPGSDGGGGQSLSSFFGHYGSSDVQNSSMVSSESVVPLKVTWVRKVVTNADLNAPEVVERKVRGLLSKLTMEKFDLISDQIIAWANRSEGQMDGRTLTQVVKTVYDHATNDPKFTGMYAQLCMKMMEQISSKVQDQGTKNADGTPITGGQLFRRYLLIQCRENSVRQWEAQEAIVAKIQVTDSALNADGGKNENETCEGEPILPLNNHATHKARRQGLGLVKFVGELVKLQMLTERIVHEYAKNLLGSVNHPVEEALERLCTLLSVAGQLLDTPKTRAHMDVHFSRMKELVMNSKVSLRIQFMLQDVIELRARGWVARITFVPPPLPPRALKNADKGTKKGPRRDGERPDFPLPGSDVLGPPQSPLKAGDLSKFGKIIRTTPMTFGSGIAFSTKYTAGNPKHEGLTQPSSSPSTLSTLQTGDAAAEAFGGYSS